MSEPIRTVLLGASGRMGAQLLRLLPEFPELQLHAATASPHSAALGRDAAETAGLRPCGVPLSAWSPGLLDGARLVIDFSSAAGASGHLAACASAGVPLLLGTTGLPVKAMAAEFERAAARIALLVAPNTSPGVNLLLALVRTAARALPQSYDIEIIEAHHRNKSDAPSGTALAIGAAAAEGRGVSLEDAAIYARQGHTGPRAPGAIGFATVRGGDVVGEHEIAFLGEGERLMLHHSVGDRSVFARGALMAGGWLAAQPPGRYRMSDFFVR